LTLIDRVLKQNPKSYTKLDDLVEIGQNLVKAGLAKPVEAGASAQGMSEEERMLAAKREITAEAIKAALSEDDFDTAYSYVVNRLSSDEFAQNPERGPAAPDGRAGDDVLWQAAYQAGRFRPENGSGPLALRRLEQRMELLSRALFLAPPASLGEVLGSWRECEEELSRLFARETEAEEQWDDRGDRKVPGVLGGEGVERVIRKPREATRNATSDESPMGLFEVARGAASALSKTAFPLRGQWQKETKIGHRRTDSAAHSDATSPDGEKRMRKRDMVSNMVTGGLATGIGWVIGELAFRICKSKHGLRENRRGTATTAGSVNASILALLNGCCAAWLKAQCPSP
jgi:protein transport protein SEC39